MATPRDTTLNASQMGGDPEGKLVLSVQKAFEMAGGKGRYQKRVIGLLAIQRIFIGGYLCLCFPYLFREPIFRCKDSIDGEWEHCRATIENCSRIIEPVPDSENTLVTEFGLYCDQKYLIALCQTIHLATTVIGIFVLASLPDTRGRKTALLYSLYGVVGLSVASIIIPSAYYIVFMIGMIGLAFGPNISYTFMYLNEVSDAEYRQTGTVVINAVRAIGQMFLGTLVAWINNNWRLYILLYIGIPLGISIYVCNLWVDEPPGYLVSKERFDEAREVIFKMAQTNGQVIKDFIFSEELARRTGSVSMIKKKNTMTRKSVFDIGSIRKSIKYIQKMKSYHYQDLIKYHSLKIQVLLLSVVSLVNNFINSAITWAIPAIEAPTSWATFGISLGDLIACVCAAYLYVSMKRRPLYILSFAVMVLAFLPFALVDAPLECQTSAEPCWQSYVQVVLLVVAKCMASVISMLFFIYAAEVFPTPVRALGTALVSVISRGGAILSPMIIGILIEEEWSPMVFMGLFSIPAVVVSFYLKETKGQELPDEIEEEKQLEMRLMDHTY